MLISGKEIEKRLHNDIIITPFNPAQLGPNSYNLTLHNSLLVYESEQLDMKKNNPTKELCIPDSGLLLSPGKLYLGRTVEYTKTENLVPMIEGRSSIGRLGLFIHITAGFGDVGFAGYWTLEILCIQPIIIYPFVQVAQIFYHTIQGEYSPYTSKKYQHQMTIKPSLLYTEFQENE